MLGPDLSEKPKNQARKKFHQVPPCCLEKPTCTYHSRIKAKAESPQKAQTNIAAESQFYESWGLTNAFKEDGKQYNIKFDAMGTPVQGSNKGSHS